MDTLDYRVGDWNPQPRIDGVCIVCHQEFKEVRKDSNIYVCACKSQHIWRKGELTGVWEILFLDELELN